MTANLAAAHDQNEPCIDLEQINGLVEAAGSDGALEILSAFWKSTEDLMLALRQQIAAQSPDDASRTAHAIKGSALNVGALKLSNTVRDIENCCRERNIEGALSLVATAERNYAETVEAFRQHLGAS